jgi:hypothetical protein
MIKVNNFPCKSFTSVNENQYLLLYLHITVTRQCANAWCTYCVYVSHSLLKWSKRIKYLRFPVSDVEIT